MEIIIVGRAETLVEPELATLHLEVEYVGRDKKKVLAAAQERANALVAQLESLEGGVLEEFHTDGVRVFTQRPWGEERRRPAEHRASCTVDAVFRDFGTMSELMAEWGETEGLAVGHIRWDLTPKRRKEELAALTGRALDDAQARARLVARHYQLGMMHAKRVSDPGVDGAAEAPMFRAMAASMESGPVEVRPDRIRLAQQLKVTFEAQ
ncbi:SIMPL domain-containing protein [Tessaracoccus oleiagri]|uniref:SIMPL domain-containing protein n=1 Tax=Tessaracoccus oleiagri TaxID=686624 RepID=A0A1G9JR26_9ACTN|nr:SIMPL domain-containing protein [Tessaracoccus oleiagri]SDL39756.1 Protein of unknown function [Tessaracoccus oleiagri]